MKKLELLTSTTAKVTINFEGEEFKTLKAEVLKEFKDAKIDGFRKGHAPLDVIEKTFENQIRETILDILLRREFNKELIDNKVEPIGEVNIDKFDYNKESVLVELSFEVKPNFEVSNYKGLNVELEVDEITEETLNDRLENVAKRHKKYETLEKTVAETGDIANINFEGFVDGVAFEGGKAEGYDLILGSKSFIDTFEDQIIGKNVNDEFEVNVTFPEEYHVETLKAKPAVFKVKLNALKKEVLPEINDELAKLNGYDTIADYKLALRAELEADALRRAKAVKYEKIADILVNNTEVDLPVNVVASEKEHQITTLEQQLTQQGLNIEKFLELSKKTKEEFEKEVEDRAKKIVKFNLIIAKISETEQIKVEKEEIEKELEKLATSYRMTKEQITEELKKAKLLEKYTNEIAGNIYMNKVKDFLVENN